MILTTLKVTYGEIEKRKLILRCSSGTVTKLQETTSVTQQGSTRMALSSHGWSHLLFRSAWGETEKQAEGKNLMCCFLPVHSWHSSLPFSFFDYDFSFFSLALIVKPRVHSQPSPTAPVWLSHRKLGFFSSLLSLSVSPCMTTECAPLPFTWDVSLYCYISSVCLFLFCFLFLSGYIGQSAHLFKCLFLCILLTKHTHTHQPFVLPCMSVCHSQRTGLAGEVQLAPQTHGSQSAFSCVLEWYLFFFAVPAFYLILL